MKITIKTNGKTLKKGKYKAKPKPAKKYKIKKGQTLAKVPSKKKKA